MQADQRMTEPMVSSLRRASVFLSGPRDFYGGLSFQEGELDGCLHDRPW